MSEPNNPLADITAERAVLSSILQEQVTIENLQLRPSDFSAVHHQTIYAAMLDLWATNCPLTPGLIAHDLIRTKQADKAAPDGNVKDYLTGLHTDVSTSDHIQHYAAIVAKMARVRNYVNLSVKVIKMAHDQANPDDLDNTISDGLLALTGGNPAAVLPWADSFPYYERLLDERTRKASLPAAEQSEWPFPWKSWNDMIDPAEAGAMIVIGGGTSVGKTVVGESIAEHWARCGHKIAYFHLELNKEMMLDRRTIRFTGLRRRELLGKVDKRTRTQITEVQKVLATWAGEVEYVHCPGWTIDQITTQIRSLHAAGQCDAFVIDYLEKIQGTDQQWRRLRDQYKIEADNTERLKTVGEMFGLRSCLLAQLTKDGNDVSFDNLTLSKIRGAGEKTERANVVGLMHRERMPQGEVDASGKQTTEPGQRSRRMQTRFDKNTMGKTGIVEQTFHASSFLIVDNDVEPCDRQL